MSSSKAPKRYDSWSKNSLETSNGGDHHQQPSPTISSSNLDDENFALKKRIVQLEVENEKLKASVFFLSQKLAKKGESAQINVPTMLSTTGSVLSMTSLAKDNHTEFRRPSDPGSNNGGGSGGPSRLTKEFSSMDLEDKSLFHCRSTLIGHESAVYACKFSHDGSSIISTSLDTTVRIWNPSSGQMSILGHHRQTGTDLCWRESGVRVVSSAMDMTVKEWDTVKISPENPLSQFSTNGIALSVTYIDSHTIAVGTNRGYIQTYDNRSGKLIFENKTDHAINAISFTGESGFLISGDGKGILRALDVRKRESQVLYVVEGHRAISGLTIGGNKYLAMNSYDNSLKLFAKDNKGGLELLHVLHGHRNKNWPIRSSFSKSAQSNLLLATGSATSECCVFGYLPYSSKDMETNSNGSNGIGNSISLLQKLQGHTDSVYSCDFHSDNLLVTASADSTLKVWLMRNY